MTPTKVSDKIRCSDVSKQRNDKIIWPVAPDGYIPNSIVRSLAPFPKFIRYCHCVDKGLHVKEQEEDRTLIVKKQFNYLLRKHFPHKEKTQNNEYYNGGSENGLQSEPEETTGKTRASLEPFQSDESEETETKSEGKVAPLRRAASQRQHSLQNRQKLLQQNAASGELQTNAAKETLQTNASSVDKLHTNAYSVDKLQTNASSVDKLHTNASSVDKLQTNASSVDKLQTNAASAEELQRNATSVNELKNKEDVDFTHPSQSVLQSLSAKSNGFPTKQATIVKKGQKDGFNLPEGLSLSPMMQQEIDEGQLEKDGLKQEISSSILQPNKSFQDSTEKRHASGIGDLNQNMHQKNFSLKKLKSFVAPLLPMGDRRPDSVLMYLYKRSKAES